MRSSASLLVSLVLTGCFSEQRPPGAAESSSTGVASFASSGEDPPTTGDSSTADPGTASATADATTADPSAGSASDTGATATGDDTTGEAYEDEALLRQAIAGDVDPEEALRTISDRGGLPVLTSEGDFLFACLCGPGEWQLAGDHDGWAGMAMQTTGPLWWAEAAVAEADGSLYKFHDLETESWIADPLGRRYGYDANGRYSLVRASAGHLERWYGLAGAGLQPRDLQVFVPVDGEFTHALYVHDGQNLFDPGAMFGYWKLQDSVPPGLLLVGVDNTPARIDEYTHVPDVISKDPIGGEAGAYAEFIDGVVRPRMEAAYGAAGVVGTMGSSLGGLVSLVIADLYPGRYAMAISLSGTVGWGSISLDNETIIERYMAAGHRDFAIYIDSGGNGTCGDADMDGIDDDDPQASDNFCENAQLRDVLVDVGYSEGVDLWYVHAPGEPHNEGAWAQRVGVPMTAFVNL